MFCSGPTIPLTKEVDKLGGYILQFIKEGKVFKEKIFKKKMFKL